MQIMKIIVKAVLGLAVALLPGGNLLYKLGIFGVVYGFATYYLWFFKMSAKIIGSSIIINIISPLVPTVIVAFAIGELPLGGVAESVGSCLVVIASYIYIAADVRKLVHPQDDVDAQA